jgi:hypothetical protein
VSYKPAKDASDEVLKNRKECLETFTTTSHDAIHFRRTGPNAPGAEPVCENERKQPSQPPVLSDRAKQLAGVLAY